MSLFLAKVMHKRTRPRVNQFVYHVYYLCFALSQQVGLKNALLSLNRFNALSFYEKDHGPRDGSPLLPWMQTLLRENGIHQADGEIVMIAHPRLFGYVFNPVTFWFCLDKAGALRAVLAEVSNTFGEHHNYLIAHDDNRPIMADDWLLARKVFHVSPFMEVKGHYRFRFHYSSNKIGVWLNYYDTDYDAARKNEGEVEGPILLTSLSGFRRPLSAYSVVKLLFNYPLMTFAVVFRIHYQAVKLWWKKTTFFTKPSPPENALTR